MSRRKIIKNQGNHENFPCAQLAFEERDQVVLYPQSNGKRHIIELSMANPTTKQKESMTKGSVGPREGLSSSLGPD
jgi:hypothetical protein